MSGGINIHPTYLSIADVWKHLPTLFVSNCAICHWRWACQKKSEFDWQGPGVSLSSFSMFQMFKNKKNWKPHLRMKSVPKELEGVGRGCRLCRKSCRNCLQEPHPLDWFTLAQFSVTAFQWSHLFEAHLPGPLLWLIIKCICSWGVRRGGGRYKPNLKWQKCPQEWREKSETDFSLFPLLEIRGHNPSLKTQGEVISK